MKYTRDQLISVLSRAPLRVAYIPHVCRLCTGMIERFEYYRDGGGRICAHEKCVEKALNKGES